MSFRPPSYFDHVEPSMAANAYGKGERGPPGVIKNLIFEPYGVYLGWQGGCA